MWQDNAHGCNLPDTESGNRRCENPCPTSIVSVADRRPSESLPCLRHPLRVSAGSAALHPRWRGGNFGHRTRPSGPLITALGPQRSAPRSRVGLLTWSSVGDFTLLHGRVSFSILQDASPQPPRICSDTPNQRGRLPSLRGKTALQNRTLPRVDLWVSGSLSYVSACQCQV